MQKLYEKFNTTVRSMTAPVPGSGGTLHIPHSSRLGNECVLEFTAVLDHLTEYDRGSWLVQTPETDRENRQNKLIRGHPTMTSARGWGEGWDKLTS